MEEKGSEVVGALIAVMVAAIATLLWRGISLAFLIWVAIRTLQMMNILP